MLRRRARRRRPTVLLSRRSRLRWRGRLGSRLEGTSQCAQNRRPAGVDSWRLHPQGRLTAVVQVALIRFVGPDTALYRLPRRNVELIALTGFAALTDALVRLEAAAVAAGLTKVSARFRDALGTLSREPPISLPPGPFP